MPGLSGVELAKKVRETHPGIRILLLTGFEGGLAEYSDLSFIDQIMRKPIRKADLLEAVFELSVDG
jgi:two-component SAPR family response regulator